MNDKNKIRYVLVEKTLRELKDYGDVEPWAMYKITGEQLFQIMDAVEGK